MKTVTLLAALLITTAAAAQTQIYPDLPTGIKNGVGGLIGNTIYAGLGTAGQKFYALDLSDTAKGWTESRHISQRGPRSGVSPPW